MADLDCDIDDNLTPSTPSSDDEGGVRQRILEQGADSVSDFGVEVDGGVARVLNSYERLVAAQNERACKGIRCEVLPPLDDEITEDVPADYQERLGRHNVPRKADIDTLRNVQRSLQSEVNTLKEKAKNFRMYASKFNKGNPTYTDFDLVSLLRWVREGKRGVLGKIPFAGWGLRWEYLARLQIGIEHKKRQLQKIRKQIHSLHMFKARFNHFEKETHGVVDQQYMEMRTNTRLDQTRFEQLLVARQSWESTFEVLMYMVDISGTYKTICQQFGKQNCQKDGPSIAAIIRQIILQVSADAPSVSRATPPDVAWQQILQARAERARAAEERKANRKKIKCVAKNYGCGPDNPSEEITVDTVSVEAPADDLGAHRELYYLFENVEHSLMEVLLDLIKLESRSQYWCDEVEGMPTIQIERDFLEDWEKPVGIILEVPSEDVGA